MNDAGKVAFTPKGDYSSTVTYEYLDTVVYNGNAYVALKTTTGNAPTDSDTDENWKLLARGGTSVPIATEKIAGVVKAGSDVGVSDDGSMILKTDYTSQESLAELTSGESRTTFFGKIAKAVSTLISHTTTSATSSVLGHVKLTDSAAVTDSTGLALPATEKNASVEGTLANQISELNTNLTNYTYVTDHKNSFVNSGSVFVYSKTYNKVVVHCYGSVNADVVTNGILCSNFPVPVFGFGALTIVDLSTGTSGECLVNSLGQLFTVEAILKTNHEFAICGSYMCK